MPTIEKWNILHLPRRVDRAPLALSNAERLGVPENIVSFWDAWDAEDFSDDTEITRAAIANGFPEWSGSAGNPNSLGRSCQFFNVCRFLRDLAGRDAVEMLIHDGMAIAFTGVNYDFFPDFQWFCDSVEACQAHARSIGTTFKFLMIGHIEMLAPVELIAPGSYISHGISSNSNSIRVYSSAGAKAVLDKCLSEVSYHRREGVDSVFYVDDKTRVLWNLPGAYTAISPCGLDMPADLLGSDSQGWQKYQGVFEGVLDV